MSSQIDSWKITEDEFCIAHNANRESLFTLANGFIGMRGDGAEWISPGYSKPGTFINGFFEKATILYGESAYGFAKNKQIMLNVCNAKLFSIFVDEEYFCPEYSKIESYYRELDMKNGIETIKIIWVTKSGKRLLIKNVNLVCMTRKFVAVRECSVVPLNFTGKIRVETSIDGSKTKIEKSDDPRVEEGLGDGAFEIAELKFVDYQGKKAAVMKQSTKNSALSLACTVLETISHAGKAINQAEEERLVTRYDVDMKQQETLKICKYISYVTSQQEYKEVFEQESMKQAIKAASAGMICLRNEQYEYMKKFWSNADVVIKDDDRLTQSIRFNLFHLLQSAGRDSMTSIASKGLSGEGYGGHYFWESEAYIAPVFMFSDQTIAKGMLKYRYRILDKAREQARLMGHQKGALYSWRSIDGEESSAYFPAGSAQYHINGDIAFAICRYFDATEDIMFLKDYGLEILLETARIWIDMGHYSPLKNGDFCIDCVTGPDEYTALVNNNCYTNLMARENLRNAVYYAQLTEQEYPDQYQQICKKIQLEQSELAEFQQAADHMHIPFDEQLKIHMQDDTFLQKKVLDLTKIPKEKFPLLLSYHPMFLYRHQVCKQPDLLLAQFFLPHQFTDEQKKRDYAYYEKLATHDSSLSACIFSIMAADTGDTAKAYDYFLDCIRTDLDDMQKNTKDGLHMANMAGAWMTIVHGFAGFRAVDGMIYFKPVLPKQLKGYQFTIKYRGKKLKIEVDKQGISYELLSPGKLRLTHFKRQAMVVENQKLYFEW